MNGLMNILTGNLHVRMGSNRNLFPPVCIRSDECPSQTTTSSSAGRLNRSVLMVGTSTAGFRFVSPPLIKSFIPRQKPLSLVMVGVLCTFSNRLPFQWADCLTFSSLAPRGLRPTLRTVMHPASSSATAAAINITFIILLIIFPHGRVSPLCYSASCLPAPQAWPTISPTER